ncbi:MAG: response regulator transcription factor [Puniceicoccales bacterium]|jgi:two-component system alkaline phosphatase synthesis response regulator PhoP|nr:response regulator transcription factor [Puniceicoccales bacterium]
MATRFSPLILIVEDDAALSKTIERQLQLAGMEAQAFYNAADALGFLQRSFSNLMLLDINLPDKDGISLLNELQKKKIFIPTIFITGRDTPDIKIKGFDCGADDFITKPFDLNELIARVSAVLRRSEKSRDLEVTANTSLADGKFIFLNTTVDPARLEIRFMNGRVEVIGKKEFGIISCFYKNPNAILSRKSLIHSIWGNHANVKSRSLDQYVVKVRHIFQRNGVSTGDNIKTIHGIGYMYTPEK